MSSNGRRRESPRPFARTRWPRRRTDSFRGVSPGSETKRSSSTCRALQAAAATASRCCSRRFATRSTCSRATRLPTGRHETPLAVSLSALAMTEPMMATVSYPRRFASLVKIEHTVFALPFAYVGALLCVSSIPSAHDLVWITLAMISARSLAMGLNRLIDARIDARNPRTATRELPRGLLSRNQVIVFCTASLAVFLVAVFQLDPIVRWLWPLVVIPMVVYPYLKRYTWACHFWLGFVDGLAPLGAWVAITGHLPLAPWLIGLGVLTWMAGFDIIYATMDVDIDRAQGLHSLPADFGLRAALTTTRVLHVLAVAALLAVGFDLSLGWAYYLGVALVAGLLWYENRLVRPDDLSRVNAAFFSVNGVIAVTYLAGV